MVLADFSRKQAFLTHVSVSTCIFFVIAYLILFHWYPDFYFYLDGGERAIATIFFVDVVLGPGLTLLVFKPGKKSLKFDMAVILLLQVSALAWGIKSVYVERSGLAIYYLGKVACVSHSESSGYDMTAISNGPSGKQRIAILQRPDTIKELFEFTQEAYLNNAGEIYYYSKQVAPLTKDKLPRLDKYALNLAQLKTESEAEALAVASYISNHPGHDQDYKLMPLVCRYGKALAVYDMHELKISDTLEIKTKLLMTDLDFESVAGKSFQIITKEAEKAE